jgi:hypothetical protein
VITVSVSDEGSEIFVANLGAETFRKFGVGKVTFSLVFNHAQDDLKYE